MEIAKQVLIENWPLFAFIALTLIIWLLARFPVQDDSFPYEKRVSVLTQAEQRLFAALIHTLPGDLVVLAKVRLADVIRVASDASGRQSWQNRINSKTVSFVICDRVHVEPLVVIEVADYARRGEQRDSRDEFLDQALASAKLPLVRFDEAGRYSRREIEEQVLPLLGEAGIQTVRAEPEFAKRRKQRRVRR
ncbi:MAG: DUF2726 domain-containing protein [Pirellulaceae bacterium]